MMGRTPICLAAILIAAGAAGAQPTSQSWELHGRDWQQVSRAETSADSTPDDRLDAIEGLIERGRGKDAFKQAVEWLKGNVRHPQRDRGLFLAARALYLQGNRTKAFFYCDELLDTYDESAYYQPALDLQYRIADDYLSGYRTRFLGLSIGDKTEEAIEMLFRIQQRSPGSQLAEKSLLRSADFYYARSDYELAGDAYAAYVRSYPRSPEVPRVRLRQAWSYLAQFRGLRFDATPVIDARAQLTDLMASHPELAEEENIPALVERIDSTVAQKMLTTARYYRRVDRPTAAAFLCQSLLKTFPMSPEAEAAKEMLQDLPPSAVDEAQAPPPQPTASAR